MLKRILNLFGRQKDISVNTEKINDELNRTFNDQLPTEKEADKDLYNFRILTMEELLKYPDAIHDMFVGKLDGFLIKNVLSQEEVTFLLNTVEKIKSENMDVAYTDVGFTYPPIFAEYTRRIDSLSDEEKDAEINNYFKKAAEFNHNFEQLNSVNAFGLITDLFTSLGGGRKVCVPRGVNDVGEYPFATFRYLIPNGGLMSVHCGNYFGKTFKETYSHLTTLVSVENQMSFFFMLNEPEEGGELSLFNFRWEDGQTKKDPAEDNEIILPDGTKRYVQTDPTILKNKLRPEKGDMILFQGGNIWHRVEKVRGQLPRITFGGFLSLNYSGDTIYYWS